MNEDWLGWLGVYAVFAFLAGWIALLHAAHEYEYWSRARSPEARRYGARRALGAFNLVIAAPLVWPLFALYFIGAFFYPIIRDALPTKET